MSKLFFLSFVLLVFSSFFLVINKARGDELDDINKQINDLTLALNQSRAATTPLENQLAGIKSRVAFIETDIVNKKKEIDNGYKNLAKQQTVLNHAIRNFYIKSYYNSPILVFLSGTDATRITQVLAYQKAAADQDKAIITNIALSINSLEQKKRDLEDEQTRLDDTKIKLDKIVGDAKSYQTNLTGKISELSAKQQQIVNQRLASLNIPRSAGTSAKGCSDDRGVDPGFSPRFALFTYGAPHRNGLNQYGAFGRAKANQGEEEILQAYYPNFTLKKDYDQNAQINVDGYGTFSIEDYVKRIWEVPNSWGDDGGMAALKAQAVAARTYALNSMQRNGHICTTESCQVFRPEPKGGNWDSAVEATRGWVLMDGGNPGFSQYASTHGGYILNLGKFDGSGGNPTSFSELNDRAYDKASPWFYCDWGARSQYSNTAWLKSDELADIVNVILLVRKDPSAGKHLYQVDKPNPEGTDTWDANKVKQELGSGAYNGVSDASVSVDFGSGKTTNININGQSFPASEFKDWFNVRAPANLQIVGPLFNIEKN